MMLTRGAFGGFEYDRMVVLFSMMNGKVEIPCAISTDALDSLEKSGHVKPDQRAAQFERLRDRIEDCAIRKFQMWNSRVSRPVCGAELSPAEEAMHIRRRQEVWEEINESPKAICGRASALDQGREVATEKFSVAFTNETAKTSGKDDRTIRQAARRGSGARHRDLHKIAGTSLDKGVESALSPGAPSDFRFGGYFSSFRSCFAIARSPFQAGRSALL